MAAPAASVGTDRAPSRLRRWATRDRAVIALLGGLLAAIHLTCLALQSIEAFHPDLVLMIIEGVVYAVAVKLVWNGRRRVPVGFILGLGLALRLAILFSTPYHSTDVYRYIWDGRVQAAGINPYLFVPNDPALASLRDDAIWPMINRGAYAPTIYPPAAQALFFLTTRIGESVAVMKVAMVLFEGVTVWALLRLLDREGLPRQRVLIYAWCPLPIWEFAGSGHVDAAMIALVMLAVLACRSGRAGWAGTVLGLATLVKLLPVLLLPALWRPLRPSGDRTGRPPWRRWELRLPLAFAATVALGYLPYLGAGKAVLGFLPGYVAEEGVYDGSRFWLLRLLDTETGWMPPSTLYLAISGLGLAALALSLLLRQGFEPRPSYAGALALATAAMFVLTPDYPWYFAWLLPFLCFVRSWAVLWLAVVAFVLYWADPRGPLWMTNLLFGGALAVGAFELARHLTLRYRTGSAA